MTYIAGVSSGWWNIAKTPELLGLGMKVMSVATWGANFVQVDFENTSEFFEPDVIKQIKKAKDDLNISWGAHGEIGESMAWESAIEVIWKQSHRRLHQYLDGFYDFFMKQNMEKYLPEYVNFHASNIASIGLFVERFRFSGHVTVDFRGKKDWSELLEDENNKELYNWFVDNLLRVVLPRELPVLIKSQDDLVVDALAYSKRFAPHIWHQIIKKIYAKEGGKIQTSFKAVEEFGKTNPEQAEILKESIKEEASIGITEDKIYNAMKEKLITEDEIREALYKWWLQISIGRGGHAVLIDEEMAYALVAKYLELKRNDPNEPLWNLFFSNETLESLEKKWFPNGEKKFVDKNKGEINLSPELVAIVSCRYILGHFQSKPLEEFLIDRQNEFKEKNKPWDYWYEKPAIEKLNDLKIYFTFENPEILEGQREGLQRIIHARHIFFLSKIFELIPNGTKYIRVWFDSEHYLHNGLNPLDEIKYAPSEFGEYVLGYHVGAPKPYHPVHEPIDIGSETQRYIYEYAWSLRQKGFGVKQKTYIIFERGGARGGQNPSQWAAQSAAAIRLIIEQLEKNTKPDELPLEFYGISSTGFLSEDKQLAAIKEHFFDPLKGTLSVPEEEHTFLGGEYLKKTGAQAEKWKKEELR